MYMTVKLDKKVFEYFQNPTNLTVSVNEMSSYFKLERLIDIGLEIKGNPVIIEIDENELDNNLLRNESLFSLMAIYAMGTGQ